MRIYILILFFVGLADAKDCALCKALHHDGIVSNKIIMYFSDNPVCTLLPSRKSERVGWKSRTFMFPLSRVGDECMDMLRELNKVRKDHYRVLLTSVTAPIKGLQLHIMYNDQEVGFEYERFTGIGQQHGVVFTLVNKGVLRKLNQPLHALGKYAATKKRPHIFLDGGHGGSDDGKVGHFGIKEKELNLHMTRQVAYLLQDKGYDISLSRNSDQFVALNNRTGMCNKSSADIFVSIHANGAPSERASGIETFCPQYITGITLAGSESITALHALERTRCDQSTLLAQSIHEHVLAHVRQGGYNVQDRKVKKAVSHVLLGAEKPASLIEIGFLSNEHEARLLQSAAYQRMVAQGICDGIVAYVEQRASNVRAA